MRKLSENSNIDLSASWDRHVKSIGEETWFQVVADMSLPVVDMLWQSHLVDMSQVREGIGLRGYAQRDPIVEYKKGRSR